MQENNCQFVGSRGIIKSCNHITNRLLSSWYDIYLNVDNIKPGDLVHICNTAVNNFAFNYLPKIKVPFVLISGDSDNEIPNSVMQGYEAIIKNPNVLHWYCQNYLGDSKRVTAMPIGMDYHTMAQSVSGWGPQMTPKQQEVEILGLLEKNYKPLTQRMCKIYSTFHFAIDRGDRFEAYNSIPKNLIDYEPNRVYRLPSHITQMNYAFVASPYGGGPDCHRTWEALILGCIPIIKKEKFINGLFDDLPVLLVNKWSDVTQELLEETIIKFSKYEPFHKLEKIQLSYWVNKFNSHKPINNPVNPISKCETSIIITGICRNVEIYLPQVITLINELKLQFNNYKIIIVENDSTDNTRQILDNWAYEDDNIILRCFDNMSKDRHTILPICRNMCIEEIKKLNSDSDKNNLYPFTFIFDMDNILTTVKNIKNSIHRMQQSSQIGSLCCMKNGHYRDIFALRDKICNYDCWEKVGWSIHNEGLNWNQAVEKYVNSHLYRLNDKDSKLYEVNAAFGGAALYRTDLLIQSKYVGYLPHGKDICEHISVCENIRNMGYKIYIDSEFSV